jgi:citrate lyase beta subunit
MPVHVLYGGAHLFDDGTTEKLGALARKSMATNAPDASTFASVFGLEPELAAEVHARVRKKLEIEPIEDLRVDFEDGYGVRSDEEEDGAARKVGAVLGRARGLPRSIGVRIKSLEGSSVRALRTLDLVLDAMGTPPPGFVVTLPKVTDGAQVSRLVDVLEARDATRSVGVEIMVEHPRALFDAAGVLQLPRLVAAARGHCVGAHLGTYDYTAAIGVTAAHQTASHPAADFARQIMLVSLASSGLDLSDGATTTLPIPPDVHRGWRAHFDDVRRGMTLGFYRGWDLHPAQLVSRYAAVFSFFLEALPAARGRVRAFLGNAAQATRVGAVFDDMATGQGLFSFFLRGLSCGALSESEVTSL